MSNVAIDLTKTVKEIITTMKTAIDNLNTDVSSNKTAIDNLKGQVLQAVYPVGSVYVSITDSRNPADILGFGTWEALPAGYGLVAQGTATAEDGSTLTFTAGRKSGEFKHQLTVGESARHTHVFVHGGHPLVIYGQLSAITNGFASGPHWNGENATTDDQLNSVGNNEYHNNLAPCVAAYLWKRVS